MRWVRALLLVTFGALYLGLAPGAYADCTAPNAPEGVMLYNTNENVPQYCDGTAWTRLAPPPIGLPVDGLVNHWKMDEANGNLIDSAGANNAAPSGSPVYNAAGVIDTAIDFDGAGDYFSTASGGFDPSATDFSVALWLYPHDVGAATGTVFGQLNGSGTGRSWIEIYSNKLSSFLANGLRDSTFIPVNDEWMHVVLVHNNAANTLEWYVNGSATNQLAGVAVEPANGAFRIANSKLDTENFLGLIDDVRVYNRALSAEEIARCCGGMPAADKGDFTTGLVGHWKLDETAGTIAYDSAGANNGNMQNGLSAANDAATGVRGGALDFDGTNDYIEIPAAAALRPANITFAAWFRSRGLTGQGQLFLSRSKASWTAFNLEVSNSGDLGAHIGTASGSANGPTAWTSGKNYADDQWHHAAGTYDGTTLKLYVDGQFIGSNTTNNGPIVYEDNDANHQNTHIGAHVFFGPTVDNEFNGNLDDARIYNRTLTAADVKALYMNSAKYCENPGGVPGQIYYNEDTHTPMYCDGGLWVALAQDSLSRGLVGHWKLDEASGTLADSSGNGNDGTQSGGVGYSSAGMVGTALNFDGVDDVIETEYSANHAAITLAAWIKLDSFGENNLGRILDKISLGNQNIVFYVSNDSAPLKSLRFNRHYTGPQGAWSTGADTLTTGQWYHVAVAHNGTTMAPTMYIDGQSMPLTILGGPVGTVLTNADSWLIGNRDNGTRTFDGNIDDVRVYNRALDAAEVTALYKYGLQDDGLIAYWPLNEDGGSVAQDMAGGNIGYASGGVVFSSAGGQIAGAASFDGSDDFIAVAHDSIFDITGDITLLAWMKKTNANSYGPLVAKIQNNDPNYDLWICGDPDSSCSPANDNKVVFEADGIGKLYSTSTITDTNWHHIAFTRSGSEWKIFIDGTEDATGTDGTAFNAGSDYVLIGYDDWDNGSPFDGLIDDVRIYNRGLSNAEIAEIHAAGALGLAAQDCTSPNGAEGAIIYNLDENAPQYCDGARWVRMGGP